MEGDFGVILDLVLFFIFLKMELGFIWFDIEEFGKKNNFVIVDLFLLIYGVDYFLDFVYMNKSIDILIFVFKYNYFYWCIFEEKIKDRCFIGIDFMIDGLVFLFGEDNFIKLF